MAADQESGPSNRCWVSMCSVAFYDNADLPVCSGREAAEADIAEER